MKTACVLPMQLLLEWDVEREWEEFTQTNISSSVCPEAHCANV